MRIKSALPAFAGIQFLLIQAFSPAYACSTPDALGVSRVLAVDVASTPRIGRKHFPTTLPLADKEVVLTFDDGPNPSTTAPILNALKTECTKATFFMLGRMASAAPKLAARVANEGHSIAYHTNIHPLLNTLPLHEAEAEIERGIAAVDKAAFGQSSQSYNRFFRFPGFASSPALLALMESKGYVTFGADFWASDWNVMRAEDQLALTLERLEARRGGIVLFHDTKKQTAQMIPQFLHELKMRGYKIVHVIPAQSNLRR